MSDHFEADDIVRAVAAFLAVEIPQDCQAGVVANLELLLTHARILAAWSAALPETRR
jgi:hypothetical protein